MISEKTLKTLEYDKILVSLERYAVLDCSKLKALNQKPCESLECANVSLAKTEEAFKLLYTHNISNIFYFSDIAAFLQHAEKGGTLINSELLKIASALKSARLIKSSILQVNDDSIIYLKEIASRLYTNQDFESEIAEKIISEDEISDTASNKLYSIRREIRELNASIRERLNSYTRGQNKFLQDGVVTKRQDRYVIPVKSEYKSYIKGFIHDQSASGATVFIEPEAIMELNNRLKSAILDEYNEIRRILSELSAKVTSFSNALRFNTENISEIDVSFAKATYSFKNKCVKPVLNNSGIIDIKKGRHPLIEPDKVVAIDVAFGLKYNYLLISGPNTGGKTVTLKIVGLFSLMAMSGIFIPAREDSSISFFKNIFCDVGDEQSIEQSLSTFSSHIKNIIKIISEADDKSLVLIDEIGAGTDPEEGSALALAVIEKLLNNNSKGIITTHYSRLKEFAATSNKIENASMEFDSVSLKPRYKLNIGMPGSSNAIDISDTLGIGKDVVIKAKSYLDNNQVTFENVLKKAEESKLKADLLAKDLEVIQEQKKKELEAIFLEKNKLEQERKKIEETSREQIKKIVSSRLEEAEEIIDDLKKLIKAEKLDSTLVFKAGELKNRLKNSKYLSIESSTDNLLERANTEKLSSGDKIFVKSLGRDAIFLSLNKRRNEVEILVGDIKSTVKTEDVFLTTEKPIVKPKIKISRQTLKMQNLEINVIGKNALEAILEVEQFIDSAIVNNVQEIKIIHGIGKGILLKEIREHLKKDKRILEIRKGKYGEGENGVTFAKLK